mmetsp:Transcript_22303/g.72158  ORF Transcript_22303/g.72158 Transcript_22303/m.72158 type:complete len:462 (-) Transcript_22303:230-1615(-)
MDLAEETLMEAIKLDDDAGEELEQAVKLQMLVEVNFRQSKFDKALKVASDMRSTFQKCGGRRQEEAAACLLVSQCHAARQELQKAFDVAREAQALFQEEADKQGEAEVWDLIGRLQRMAGEAQEAEKALTTAKALQHQAGDKKAQAYALQRFAGLCAAQDRFDEVLKASFEALALARALQDPKVEVEMLMLASQAQLAILMRRVKDAEETGDKSALVASSTHKEVRQALRHAREAAVLGRKNGDDYFTAGAIYATAQIFLLTGNCDAGLRAAKEAEEMWARVDNMGGSAYAVLLAAECHFARPDVHTAEELGNEALRIFQEVGEQDGEEKAQKTLARFKLGPARGPASAAAAAAAAPQAVRDEYSAASAPAAPAFKAMELEVAQRIARETALAAIGSEDELDLDSPLMDMGLDSLSAIAFREQLISSSGLKVPSSLVFDYPSLQAIAEYLVEVSAESPAGI